jgi:hypothetical protein
VTGGVERCEPDLDLQPVLDRREFYGNGAAEIPGLVGQRLFASRPDLHDELVVVVVLGGCCAGKRERKENPCSNGPAHQSPLTSAIQRSLHPPATKGSRIFLELIGSSGVNTSPLLKKCNSSLCSEFSERVVNNLGPAPERER